MTHKCAKGCQYEGNTLICAKCRSEYDMEKAVRPNVEGKDGKTEASEGHSKWQGVERGLKTQMVDKEIKQSKKYKNTTPIEESEAVRLTSYLRWRGLHFLHVPNEGRHNKFYRFKQARQGVQPGAPDYLIFSLMPSGKHRGVAIELKRRQGGRVSPQQQKWLDILSECGWSSHICMGADDAITVIREHFGMTEGEMG